MSSDDDYMKTLEVQRRYFESQFLSVDEPDIEKRNSKRTGGTSDSDEDIVEEKDEHYSDFEGFESRSETEFSQEFNSEESFSESEYEMESEDEKPKVVRLGSSSDNSAISSTSKAEKRTMRLGRAPTLAELSEKEKRKSKISDKRKTENGMEDSENIQNDLKLERLLEESHILSNNLDYSGADVTLKTIDLEAPTGKARKRALDTRMKKISATNSSTKGEPKKLENMPMAMRKGMIKTRERKVAKFEEEARNAGIVLSKLKKGEVRNLDLGKGSTSSSDRLGVRKNVKSRNRDKGLKINSVGRSTRNGLVISQKDIDRINSGKTSRR